MTESGWDKEGYLYLKKKKGGSWKLHYFGLIGGSVYLYKDVSSDSTGCAAMKGASIGDVEKDKKDKEKIGKPFKLCFKNTDGKSEEWILAGNDEGDSDEWIKALKDAVGKDNASEPPMEKRKKTKDSALFSAKKNVMGKIATTGGGQQALKQVLPEEVNNLLAALTNLIAKKSGPPKSVEIRNGITKILMKAYFQLDKKTLVMDDFMVAYKPLRESFESLTKLNDHYTMLPDDKIQAMFDKVQNLLKTVESSMVKVLSPHMKADNVMLLKRTMGYLYSDEFLKGVWGDDTLREEEDLFELCLAMNKFNSFHIYKE